MSTQHVPTAFLIALLASPAGAAPVPSVTLDKAAYEKVQALLKQRRDALREVLKTRQVLFEAGGLTPAELIDARRVLLGAELELATVADRAALSKALARHIKEFEDHARQLFEVGRIGPGEYAAARADCRADELLLLREQAGARPSEAQKAALARLRCQRVELLRQALAEEEKAFEAGRYRPGAVARAARLALEAELEVAGKPEERVAAYRTYAEGARHRARVLDTLFEAGRRIDRLERDTGVAEKLAAEVGLLRAGGKLTPAEAERLKVLQRDRRAQCAEAFKAARALRDIGRGSLEGSAAASARLLEAELDLAEAPADRVAAHRAHLKRLAEVEAEAKAMYDAGRLSAPDYLNLKATRLAAQVAFLRAGGKAAELGK